MKDAISENLIKQYRGRTADTLPDRDKDLVATLIERLAKRVDTLEADQRTALHVEGAPQTVEETTEQVDHPKHYTSHPSGIEAIEIAGYLGFALGNAWKYIARAGLKGGAGKRLEDLKKALWYVEWFRANGGGGIYEKRVELLVERWCALETRRMADLYRWLLFPGNGQFAATCLRELIAEAAVADPLGLAATD